VQADTEALTIDRLGAKGDGIAETAAGPIYVPFALPGERVSRGEGDPRVLCESPHRRKPQCRHYQTCGGCLAQHMDDALYAEWKRGILLEAFRQRGLAPDIAPLQRIAAGSRRRAVLTARRERGETVLGYHRRRSDEVFAIAECPVLAPAIVAELPLLRAIAAALAQREVRITVLATPRGLDVALEDASGRGAGPMPGPLAQVLAQRAIARFTRNGEIVAEWARPELTIAGVAVVPPPGLFVQAVGEAEAAMAEEVLAAVGGARHVADLFAGIGTFTFALARRARVQAVDGEARALGALVQAARAAGGLKPIATLVRDLLSEPLSARELDAFDCVVLNPPRAGAKAQAQQLGRARVACVVYVSCNPATLARDARLLVDGGFELQRVVPIDQFLYSAHVEAVAVLRRPARPRTRHGKGQ
jgi:23S rRNA (uracil1939-C5)-methyltransferase